MRRGLSVLVVLAMSIVVLGVMAPGAHAAPAAATFTK